MLIRALALDEARRQKEALAQIGRWRRGLFLLAAALSAAAVFGFQTEGWLALGVIAAALAAVSFLLASITDLSIRNGRKNVERILDSLKA